MVSKITDIKDISILVNNVGTSCGGEFASLASASVLAEVQTNCYPLVLLTSLLLPSLHNYQKTTGYRSLIVNLSSQSAIAPCPYIANYAATKAFVAAFSHGLAFEVKCDVVTALPGVVATKMNNRKADGITTTSARVCAKAILRDRGDRFGALFHELEALFMLSGADWVSTWWAMAVASFKTWGLGEEMK